jgi:LacI family transcriptional regulator
MEKERPGGGRRGRTSAQGREFLKTSRPTTATGRRVTMAEIARRVGVSQATVSLVLGRAPGARISQATQDRVVAAARELGYRRLPVPHGACRVVALMIDDLTTSQHVGPLIEGARDEAAAHGCLLLVIPTNGSPDGEAAAWEVLSERPTLGVIYATLLTRTVTPPAFLRGLPTVLLNCHAPGDPHPTVVPGDVAGGFAATSHLLKPGTGGSAWSTARTAWKPRATGSRATARR